jgi:GAF domain-containing protein
VLSGVNTLIVHETDRDRLFNEACRIAVEEGGFQMAWIGLANDKAKRIVPVASAGIDEDHFSELKEVFLHEDLALGHTMIAQAIRKKHLLVSDDLVTNSSILFSSKYAESAIGAMIALPLVVQDEAVGVLAIYAGDSQFFHEEERKLLTELAGDIGFAIDHIEKQDRIDYLASYDELTGLANHRLFVERLTGHMRRAAHDGHKLAVFLVDLERFKNINDSLGQAAGDALLRQVSSWLTAKTGDASLLARVDADHFSVVLPKN